MPELKFHNGRVVDEKYQDCGACGEGPLFQTYNYCPFCGAEL